MCEALFYISKKVAVWATLWDSLIDLPIINIISRIISFVSLTQFPSKS